MINMIATLALGMLCAALILWGSLVLPRQSMQFIATAPRERGEGESWIGLNLTWYGALSATAYALAATVFLFLMGATGYPIILSAILVICLLAFCVPASRLIAMVVEKKAHTFTVGGAFFAGLLCFYPLLETINWLSNHYLGSTLSFTASLAALAVAYAFGEGIGRLACVSFGCCYGKPLMNCPTILRRLFRGRTLTFYGATRKAVYEGDLEGVPLLPIQLLTSTICNMSGLIGFYLYLSGQFAQSALIVLIMTQGWRVISEQFRADYRGKGNFSAYQIMGVISVIGVSCLVPLAPSSHLVSVDFVRGITTLWSPGAFLALQGLWLAIFLYTGRSSVTGASITFHVHARKT
jgi:Prolipoprotein diacylglyceryl transferase